MQFNTKNKTNNFIKGLLIGTKNYIKNKRWETDKFNFYVSYYIFKEVEGKEPPLNYFSEKILQLVK